MGRVIYGLMGVQIDGWVKCVTIVHMIVALSCLSDAAAARTTAPTRAALGMMKVWVLSGIDLPIIPKRASRLTLQFLLFWTLI